MCVTLEAPPLRVDERRLHHLRLCHGVQMPQAHALPEARGPVAQQRERHR